MLPRQLIAGEVLRTTSESLLGISAIVTNLLEGEVVGITWYGTAQYGYIPEKADRCILGSFIALDTYLANIIRNITLQPKQWCISTQWMGEVKQGGAQVPQLIWVKQTTRYVPILKILFYACVNELCTRQVYWNTFFFPFFRPSHLPHCLVGLRANRELFRWPVWIFVEGHLQAAFEH